VLARGRPADAPVCRRVVRSVDGSVVPRRSGRYWIGTSVREAGYAAQPRLGTVREVLARAAGFLPAIEDLQVERIGIGLRPATADGMPLIGASAVPGPRVGRGPRPRGDPAGAHNRPAAIVQLAGVS